MIDKTMNFLLGELNAFLGTIYKATEPYAVLANLSMPDGSPPREIENRMVLTLTNIEREYGVRNQDIAMPAQGNTSWRSNAPLNLNLYFLLAASFPSDTAQALRFLSAAVGFLQSKASFGPHDAASFPRGLERLTVEMVNLTIGDLHNIWSCNGAKYLPSVYYKVRMVTLQDGWTIDRLPVITGTSAKV
jgi:hypothetical protein